MLKMIGLDRTKVYIGNTVKCRPPQNRDPLNVEMAACRGWLDRQIGLLHPKILVCLGRIAAKELIKEDFRITAEHGIIAAEAPAEKTLPALAEPYRVSRIYRYGKIGLTIYRRVGDEKNEESAI